MLKIRLTRRGKRNRPFFRIVVAEASAPIKGRFIEILGYLDPILKKKEIKAERVKYWLSQGAKTSTTVHNLLVEKGVIPGPKIPKFAKKKKKEEKAAPTSEVAEQEKKEEKPSGKTEEMEKPQEKQSAEAVKPQTEASEKKTKKPKKEEGAKKVEPLPTE